MTNENRPNILLIVMDTARAETVLENKEVMPNFLEFANKGTLFTNAYSTAPWTLPSHASLFTGQYTSDHGTHAGNKEFDPEVPTLAEKLQSSGYRTVGFSNNVWISSEFGFGRGFDNLRTSMQLVEGGANLGSIAKEYSGIYEQALAVSKFLIRRNGHRTLINGLYSKFFRNRYDDGARLTNWWIKRWLSSHKNREEPFFLFVNYLEPHLEYDPPKEFRYKFKPDGLSRSDLDNVNQDPWSYICDQIEMDQQDFEALSALYKAELNYLDYRLGRLFKFLEKKGLLDETVVILTGDHGENLGDHGLMDHQYCVYDTLLHVPLIIRYPSTFPEGETFDSLVELRDIYPTLLDLANIPENKTSETSSNSLLRVVNTGNGRKEVIAQYLHPQPSMKSLRDRVGELPNSVLQYDRALHAVRSKHWKVIEGSDGTENVYELPDETESVTKDGTNELQIDQIIKGLRETVGNPKKATPSTDSDISITKKAQLEDLGYL